MLLFNIHALELVPSVAHLMMNLLQKYGEVQYVNIPKCKETGKKRDLAFIVFKSTYHAALAVEQCPARTLRGKMNITITTLV